MVDPSERILDANLNRAREALRVLEDYARFALEDAALTTAAKTLRHTLADAVQQAGLTGLIAARDIVGDIGCSIAAAGEYERASLTEVVLAAGKRLTEALRAIEEVGKTRSGSFGAAIERMRYGAYDLEKRLAVRMNPCRAFVQARLYVLITESLCIDGWLSTAEAALRGGADVLQLREKTLGDCELLERAKRLARLCHDAGALCIVNDRPDVALLAGADGVHVGQDDLPVAEARRVVGQERIAGVSTHSLEQARAAIAASPDYLAVGPMFETTTKAVDRIAGPALWSVVRQETALPLVAIGGITADNVDELVKLGCRCVAVCQTVVGAADVEAAARRLRTLLEGDPSVSRG
ncbi:MAG: thiamine phosphate synthase [Planctomycetota bacterium]